MQKCRSGYIYLAKSSEVSESCPCAQLIKYYVIKKCRGQWRYRSTILILRTTRRSRWVVSFTPQQLYPRLMSSPYSRTGSSLVWTIWSGVKYLLTAGNWTPGVQPVAIPIGQKAIVLMTELHSSVCFRNRLFHFHPFFFVSLLGLILGLDKFRINFLSYGPYQTVVRTLEHGTGPSEGLDLCRTT